MKTQENKIIEKAVNIAMNEGIGALTIHKLAIAMALKEEDLFPEVTKNEDILLILLKAFENEITDLVQTTGNGGEAPESDLELLFKRLYFLFQQKPYYLSIIFDSSLPEKDVRLKKGVLRIRNLAESHLTAIINAGKAGNIFKTNEPAKVLAGKILSGFRLFIKDEQRVNEMILELKTMQTLKRLT